MVSVFVERKVGQLEGPQPLSPLRIPKAPTRDYTEGRRLGSRCRVSPEGATLLSGLSA